MRGALIAAIMAVTVLGCSSTAPAPPTPAARPPQEQPAAPEQVKLGMTTAQVKALMGKPDVEQAVEAAPGMEVWVYDVGRVLFSNGKVVLTNPDPLPVR